MQPIRVVAGAVRRDGRLLVARRRAGIAREGLWELPGGKVEPGETDQSALARELMEELHIDVRVHARPLGEVVHRYPDVEVRLLCYGCDLQGGSIQLTDHDQVGWVTDVVGINLAPADVPLVMDALAWASSG